MDIKLTSSDVIAESGITFGTSGARGLVSDFTASVCAAFAVAFIKSIDTEFSFNTVALAIDNRPSSYSMAQACAEGLKQLNLNVVYYGIVPTPAIAYKAMQDSMPSIMVTGSHIPFDRNGLKFYRPDGEITKSDEKRIITQAFELSELSELPELVVDSRAAEEYINRYVSLFDTMWLSGKRVGIYEHSSAGRDLYYRIFERMGAEVISLGRSERFVPIDTEAVSEEDKAKSIKWSNEYSLDVVLSTDGDGDRPLVSDENGNWLRGDILGLLCSEALNIEALAVPISCNTAIESCKKFKYVKRTKIGSPYVIHEFEHLASKFKSVAGFEANGGFLLGTDVNLNGKKLKALPTRDAVLPAIMLLVLARDRDREISEIVESLPQRYTYSDRIKDYSTSKSQSLITWGREKPVELLTHLGFDNIKILKIDTTDGLRVTLSDETIVHLRPSGNAPELRCYVETQSLKEARELVVDILKNIQK